MPWAEALIKSNSQNDIDPKEGRVISYAEALNEAFAIAMKLDPSVFLCGQGLDDPLASFGVTKGLADKPDPLGGFGMTSGLSDQSNAQRVFDVPLSEEGITGICVGAAMAGSRPINIHNRPDFLLLAFNQLITHASKMSYMDVGKTKVPLVIWSAIGRGWGSGAQHSQAIQGMLIGVPGLKVIMPSTPYDAKGLMLSAIADNNPVVIFEHRWMMRQKGAVPEGLYTIPIGKGVYRRRGKDLTIIGTSHTLDLAIKAADEVAKDGISAEIIDLRTIKPYDQAIIEESVKKTGRAMVVDTGWATGGVCAEIGCFVAEKCFKDLKAPVVRVGLPDVPTPAGFTLEQYYYPDVPKLAAAIRKTVAG